ncbi:putative ribonuclease H-like domain-containing protein, partial [Tanacetum coccineum]
LPFGKKAIGTKWVYRNKKDERGVVVRNKARLVAQGHRQEEGIDYDEVFALVARLEAIRIFLAFASYMGFIVYQMNVKSAFLYGKIDEEEPQQEVVNSCRTHFLQCKKQTIVATSTTEAEYVAAASCCGQVLWIQNQIIQYIIPRKSTMLIYAPFHKRMLYEKKLNSGALKSTLIDNVADLLQPMNLIIAGLIEFRLSWRRVIDGTEALQLPTLFTPRFGQSY